MGIDRNFPTRIGLPAAIIAAAVCIFTTAVFAAMGESDVPSTSLVPAAPSASASGAASAPAGESMAPGAPVKTPAAAATRKKTVRRAKFNASEVEPAKARLKLLEDSWAYVEPADTSAHVERVHKGKYVIVTGSTRYFVRVKLKSGKTAYVEQSAVDLVRPTDKIFRLTSNAPVLDRPNHLGKKLAEVHTPHDVHVVGVALNYMKIRMRSGLEGYIPATALQ